MLKKYFKITVAQDKLTAEIHIFENYAEIDEHLNEKALRQFLQEENILYGIIEPAIQQVLSKPQSKEFPLKIAEGKSEVNGIDGKLEYMVNFNSEIKKTPNWNFRDVMRIPSVNKGDKIATIVEPTMGRPGKDVYGNKRRARQGKPVLIKAGKNVTLNPDDHTFYANSEGQVSVTTRNIHVHSVYELKESLSMKVGNIDFVGSVIIHGDVPTGYSIKAKGDIKIFGMVEAASLMAEGSIFVSEGMAGLKTGSLQAGENVHIGYLNQGIVTAGDTIYVENSILHSECTAENNVFCQQGNIIGGSLSVGGTVEAKDVGNRMNTKTEVYFGINKLESEKEKSLLAKKLELEETLSKLKIIGSNLEKQQSKDNPKLRITLLRQRHSFNKITAQLDEINRELEQMDSQLGKGQDSKLIVKGVLYPSVIVAFGKYKRTIDKNHHYVQVKVVEKEISLAPI
ncbi:DUF342 domain-containing protein [Virgibacillus sp. W0430]|uniref:DUF342 domain-containing protein n=1 Tax=Virgibacillus sp. W0430 TaxID=3391580 RepID=UPI003F44B32F